MSVGALIAARGRCDVVVGHGRPWLPSFKVILIALIATCLGVQSAAAGPVESAVSPTAATQLESKAQQPLFTAVRQSSNELAPSEQVVASMATAPAAKFVPVGPERVTDTRLDDEGPLHPWERIVISPDDSAPPGITAIAFNVVATGQTASGYIEVAPKDALPGSSTVNWGGAQQTIANGFITRVNPAGQFQITMESVGSTHVVLDITGIFAITGSYAPPATSDASLFNATDRRIYDSRKEQSPLQPDETRYLNIFTDGPATPPPAVAAAINVTATGTTGSGVFTASPLPDATTSTVNWTGAAQTVANAVIVPVLSAGWFTVTNNGPTPAHLVIDLTGVFVPVGSGVPGTQFYAMDPVRSYDSRIFNGRDPVRPLTSAPSRWNLHPVPSTATAIALNTTITGTTGTGFISITPTPPGGFPPGTSTVNWYDSPTTRANGAIVEDFQGSTYATAGGNYSTHYILDVAGYFQ